MGKKIFFIISLAVLLIATGCNTLKDPLPTNQHPESWSDAASEDFHGAKVLISGSESCQTCHGIDLKGGESKVACSDCHTAYPHNSSWSAPSDSRSHAAYIRGQNWSFDDCTTCHGADYKGGRTGSSCFDCHTGTNGPEDCTTCHGSLNASAGQTNPVSLFAPPEDLSGNLTTDAPGVGAHQVHLNGAKWTTTAGFVQACKMCHTEVVNFSDANHIDDTPGVDMHFSAMATHNGTLTPAYDPATMTCSNVYCHGAFEFEKSATLNQYAYTADKIRGIHEPVQWNRVGVGEVTCGSSCHGLPPEGHIGANTCSPCHGSVVDPANNIIDKTKHMNGQVDLN